MNKPFILLVEDNPDDEELTRLAFAHAQVNTPLVVARDGAEALNYLLSGPASGPAAQPLPQVVLLDLKLPEVDGLEVLRRLRAERRTRFLPVVVLTSSHEEQDRLQSYASGANSYVRKPVNYDQFIEAARQLGRYWLALNEPPPSD